MPTVPTYDSRQVRDAAAPDQYQRISASPDDFGAATGRALQGAANDLERTGRVFTAIAEQEQEKDQAALLLNAQAEYSRRINAALYSDETGPDGTVRKGLFTTQGSEAMGVAGRFATLEDDVYKQIVGTLPDPRLQEKFNQIRTRSRSNYETAAMKHEADNRLKFQSEAQDASVKTATLNAVNAFDKPEIVSGEIDNIRRAVVASNVGAPPEVLQYKTRVAVSGVHKSIVGRMLSDDPKGAQAYYEAHKGDIEGGDHLEIQRALEVPMRRVRGEETVNRIIGGAGNAGSKLVRAMVQQESSGNPRAESPVGASGLMQVMPETGRYISDNIKDGTNLRGMSDAEIKEFYKSNPAVNLAHGAWYMQEQLTRYGGDIEAALVAYNAGPRNADKFVNAKAAGNPDPYSVLPKRSETEPYVRKIMANFVRGGGDAQFTGQTGVATRGQSVIDPGATLNGLPVPGNMAAFASGARNPAAAPAAEALAETSAASAAASLTPFIAPPTDDEAPAATAVQPVPDAAEAGKPVRVRVDDFDPDELRAQAQAAAEADPENAIMIQRKVDAYIARREREKKSVLKEVANTGWAHVIQGGDTTDLPPEVYSALVADNPQVIKSMEEFVDRRERRQDKTDEATYYKLSQMKPEDLTADDFNLMDYANKLSGEHLRFFAQKQADARKGIRDITQGAGILTVKELGNMALGKMGIATTGKDGAKPENEARAGLFFMRLEQEVSALQAAQKRKATNEEVQKIVDALSTPVSEGWRTSGNKYRFEMGTAAENEQRLASNLPPIGEETGVFEAASEPKDIPLPALQQISQTHRRLYGDDPTPTKAVNIYNEILTASTGRPVPVPSDKINSFKSAMAKALQRVPDDKELPMLYSRWLRREYPLRIGE
ncbi:lytic transglycosylase domain-containing protein [Microvirga sp. G4-2]|uniref:lytic transglycosylase domain-containing protein n=1 Tax=Microvirga sp. G4-2 TaxID=3434467 RepID=UPI0040442303